jgi:hypothetical protein
MPEASIGFDFSATSLLERADKVKFPLPSGNGPDVDTPLARAAIATVVADMERQGIVFEPQAPLVWD